MEDAITLAPEQQLGWTLPNVRTVDAWQVDLVLAKIAKVNRRAAKLGAPEFTFEVSLPRLVKVPKSDRLKEVVDIAIRGETVQVGGYRFLGRVDFEDGLTLVNARPGEEIPPRYRSATTFCDHCASQRQRNAVFIFRRDGDSQHVQVGRTCLKDFLGHDPAQVLWSANLWSQLCDELDDESFGGGRASYLYEVDSVLQMAAAVVRAKGGFISRTQAKDHDHMAATADLVADQLDPPVNPPKGWVKIKPEQQDVERAAAAKAWALETMLKPEQSDYEYNLTALLQADTVAAKRRGMVVSLIGVYARHLGDVVAREKRVNAHVGQINQRRKFTATFAGANAFGAAYGTLFIGRFDTPEGLLVYKGSSPFWAKNTQPGEVFELTGTIKEHGEYKGTKQTMIQRVKVAEAVAA